MAINFTKAIELEVVRKLKSHSKVGYQDHPNGDKQCSGCSMFVAGNPPACTHVAPPIEAHGYCDDFERLDPNARARAAIGKAKSFSDTIKAFNEDQPRDDKGMWTSSGGGISSAAAASIHGTVAGADISSHLDNVTAAHQSLDDAMNEASNAEDDAQEHEDEHGKQDPELEAAAVEAQTEAAKAAVDLHAHLSALHEATGAALARIEQHLASQGITRVKKNMTVGDVHAATALGNQPSGKGKKKDFLTTIGEIKGAKLVAVPAMDFGKSLEKIKADAKSLPRRSDETVLTWKFDAAGVPVPIEYGKNRIAPNLVAYWPFEKRTVNVLFMRHGPTRFNNQTDMSKDRVRSWNNVPLTAEGIEDAEKAGEKLKDEGIGYIVSSDLGRAVQTSKLVGKAVGVKPVHEYGMRPWNLGKFTGMSTDDAHDGIMHHVENPDEEVEGGESFNTFKARAAQAMLSHIKKAGKKKMLVVSHHRNERLFAAMRPDGTVDPKKFMKTGEDPGDFTEMEFSTDELQNALRNAQEGQGEAEVGKVWGSNAELPDGVRNALPAEAQTVWRKVANNRINAGQSDESAIRQAWTAVKNGWSKTKDGSWVRKSWLEPDGVHEFLEAEIAKLGGESSIAKPTDNINVALQLTSLDDQNARSPFPYDQYFFANLRNDQKERLLAALTDQDALPVKTIPLSSLSAIQDRVDPNKIQSMIEGAPEKLALVVRTGPGRYGIADGHHRLTAAMLSGVKTVDVRYLDIEGFDPRVHTDNNPGSKGEPVSKALIDINADGDLVLMNHRTGDVRALKIDAVVPDQQKVFGWASVTQIGDEQIIDKQGDIIEDDELEKAADDYVLYHRVQGDMHERMGVGRLIRSHIYNQEMWNLGHCAYDDETGLKKFGWFVGFKVDDPGVWARIRDGALPEFSIGGKARRETVEA